MILVDTNIAGRLLQPTHRHFSAAKNAVDQLTRNEGESFCISVHSLYELAFVLTKPITSNGFGYSAQQAYAEITNTQAMFNVLPESIDVFLTWKNLIAKYSITNRPIFDAKLVATMIQNGAPRILTFNDKDFDYFSEVKAINPFDVLGIARIP